jgi:hypothetical protein
MRRNLSKAQSERIHAKRRAADPRRYGVHLNRHDLKTIIGRIRGGFSELLHEQSLRVSIREVEYNGILFKVAYDSIRKEIITFLPQDRPVYNSPREFQSEEELTNYIGHQIKTKEEREKGTRYLRGGAAYSIYTVRVGDRNYSVLYDNGKETVASSVEGDKFDFGDQIIKLQKKYGCYHGGMA